MGIKMNKIIYNNPKKVVRTLKHTNSKLKSLNEKLSKVTKDRNDFINMHLNRDVIWICKICGCENRFNLAYKILDEERCKQCKSPYTNNGIDVNNFKTRIETIFNGNIETYYDTIRLIEVSYLGAFINCGYSKRQNSATKFEIMCNFKNDSKKFTLRFVYDATEDELIIL